MFNKLRNRFLLLNLVTLSFMMLIAFAAIYLITYSYVRGDIEMELHKLSEFNRKPGENPDMPGQDGNRTLPKPEPKDGRPGAREPLPADQGYLQLPPERSVSFYVVTDASWNVTDYSSRFDTDGDFYQSAAKEVSSQNKSSGSIKLDGNHWAYIVTSAKEGYRISFLDITSQQGILTNLIYTFLIASLVMLFVIYLISGFFANKYIKPVKEAFDKQKQFIADASHELKTPLAVINTNADVLLSFGEDTINNQSKWIHYIKKESGRMAKLTNDLLYLTQLDCSGSPVVFSRINLSETVENVILTMEGVVYEHNIRLNYEIEPGLSVNGNAEQIREVVMILLDNAVKYSDAGGSIELGLKRRGGEVVLSITNTGPGIAQEHLANIFDRFYRTDRARTRKCGGYGLGLAIARRIVEQHNGGIQVKSIVNEKTTFSVELPLA